MQEALPAIERAASLCRGEFLEGLSLPGTPAFDEWLTLQRAAWHHTVSTLLQRLSQMQAEAGETAQAITTARLHITHDPFNEAAYRDLMRLLLTSGDRKSAEKVYNELRTLLSEEWGAEPSNETEELASRIAEGIDPAPEQPTRTTRQALPPPAIIERYMVGRAAEFGALIERFRAASGGQPQLCHHRGEAGIGKTRLATEFTGWASAHGVRVMQGRAFEMGGASPTSP